MSYYFKGISVLIDGNYPSSSKALPIMKLLLRTSRLIQLVIKIRTIFLTYFNEDFITASLIGIIITLKSHSYFSNLSSLLRDYGLAHY